MPDHFKKCNYIFTSHLAISINLEQSNQNSYYLGYLILLNQINFGHDRIHPLLRVCSYKYQQFVPVKKPTQKCRERAPNMQKYPMSVRENPLSKKGLRVCLKKPVNYQYCVKYTSV